MKVYYLKSTVSQDGKIRNEKRTDWSFGSRTCFKRGTDLPNWEDLGTDYDLVYEGSDFDDLDIEEIFAKFQVEFMPDFLKVQARSNPWRSHTSMSVGDIVVDNDDRMWYCDSVGFIQIRGN